MEGTEEVNEDCVMDESAATSAPSQEGVTYYAVHIPNMDLMFPRLYTNKANALMEVKKHKKARFKPFKTRWEAITFSLHGSDSATAQDSSSVSEVDGALVNNAPGSPKMNSPSCVIADAEKPSSFKGPKAQDLVRLRRAIESGDLRLVKNTIWDNPRYLVSSGDTPAILQEGSRYNALHVAAKSKNAAMAELILETISNPNFFRLLYNFENEPPEEDTSVERATVMLDLYLNTPDKGVNETSLHFASKFGALDVVKVLVSYSQCNRRPQNKMGHTPLDIVCSRVLNASNELKREITALLENEFYVPVLRSADQSVQPIIGVPFSPKQPPLKDADPTRPPMEIHAFAGPMSKEQAEEFRKHWRTPQRNPAGNHGNLRVPHSCPPAIHLRDCEKGLERAGRALAAQYHVPWLEYWPFLDTFVNLAAPEGLALLEDYLKGHFLSAHSTKGDMQSSPRRNSLQKGHVSDDSGEGYVLNVSHDSLNSSGIEPEVLSPVSNLCMTLKALTIMDDSIGSGHGCGSPESTGSASPPNDSTNTPASNGILSTSIGWSQAFFDWSSRKTSSAATPVSSKSSVRNRTEENSNQSCNQDTELLALSQPGLSPFLYVERSLRLFAKRIAAILHHIASSSSVTKETVYDVLSPEVKHIQSLVSSYMADERFEAVGYQVVHFRVATSVAEHLVSELTKEECDALLSCLSDLASKSEKKSGGLSSDEDEEPSACTPYRQPVSCRARSSASAAQKAAEHCVAMQTARAVERLKESVSQTTLPRAPVRTEAECVALWAGAQACSCSWPLPQQRHKRTGSALKRERERISSKMEVSTNSRDIVPRQLQFDNEPAVEDEEDDSFFTPPSSPAPGVPETEGSSDEEMESAEEGPNVFIMGEAPTKLDVNVLNAISSCEITPRTYPNIYRWRHSVQLYDQAERERWPTANFSSRTSNLSATPYTPAPAPVTSADLSPSTPKTSRAVRRPTLAQSSRNCQPEDSVPSSPIWSRITGPLSPVCSTVAKCTPSVACSPSWSRMH